MEELHNASILMEVTLVCVRRDTRDQGKIRTASILTNVGDQELVE